ncbi:MAG: hypothetical protein B6I24_08550 [Bacteroidetes bacterium 4572_128]|nr:MAG: hypothetical protein B6I24_08550 [Bacteroidetes bacterium 4572_128]
MDLKKIFEERIKIEPKVMSLETIFNNPRRTDKTNFKPEYQRKYVWDVEKATYFIESIILGTEIPPLIFFNNEKNIEVIDGRQRYETILKFLKNEIKLRKSGLHKFTDLANKNFDNLENKLKDIIWDTKLRIIEFSFHSPTLIDKEIEHRVKNEIFKRYNSGITPLKPTDVDKAIYIENDLNSLFKSKIKKDKVLYDDIADVLVFDKKNEEILFKKIRRLLVLHQIPIKQYASKKDVLINKFFENFSESIETEKQEDVFQYFLRKINILKRIVALFNKKGYEYNHLIAECVFWTLQIFETEKKNLSLITQEVLIALVKYIDTNKEYYKDEQSSFAKILQKRYKITAFFFEEYFKIDLSIYINTTDEFKTQEKELNIAKEDTKSLSGIETLRINKPEPSSITIEDIVRQMGRERFLIRPPYQRKEVINKKKSSAIIESIILGIKIPPIFIFKRKDGISEVLDGQQRLLSILGFIQEDYRDENFKRIKSEKDGYTLNLKDGILKELHGKSFEQLPNYIQERILEFDLWKIDIEEKNNPQFDQVDLFVRLDKINEIYKNSENWFYYRKSNTRMDNESLYTALSYMQYKLNKTSNNIEDITDFLDIYKIGNKINFRLKAKSEITKIIENSDNKTNFLKSCSDIETIFIKKVQLLSSNKSDISNIEKNLNNIFNIESRRTQQRFYALWFFLSNINIEIIQHSKEDINSSLNKLFRTMEEVETKEKYLEEVKSFWNKYN